MISSIAETKIQCTLKVSHHMFCSHKVNMPGFYRILTQNVFTTKHISSLLFVRYINEPIICLYKVASTNSNEVSTRSFNFVSMGVYMDLHFNMSSLFERSFLGSSKLQDLRNNALGLGLSSQTLQ